MGDTAGHNNETDVSAIVERRAEIAHGVVQLDLVAADGGTLPGWQPGAHIDLVLGEHLVRQYSLCGDPADSRRYRVAVLREPAGRGGSEWVHAHLQAGDRLTVRGPRNHFELRPAARYRFIAGGIGITPILPMLRDAAQAGAEWSLVYGGRSLASMAFVDELRASPEVQIVPQDAAGLIDVAAAIGDPADDTLVYCCGPEPLLKAVGDACAAWPGNPLRAERFAAVDPGSAGPDVEFEVELARTGVTVTVPPEESILSVVMAGGVDVVFSCEDGVCGSCETVVLDGRPDHRDSVMTAEEHEAAGTMQICVSRSFGKRLVLDV